jgi:hypothetical protein|tara:strand:+ start:216 stop:1685 length:1470 start_codon:yes stop_codon:yes gene_type:complete
MASNTAPVVDRIRIIPRPDDFLDRNVGASGEVFYDKQANTLRLYSGKQAGGFSLLTAGNLSQQLADAGVALLEKTVTVGVDTVNGQATGVFYIDGVEKPQLDFVRGYTYLFDQSDETNNSYAGLWHPLMFATTPNGDLIEGGAHYNPGIVYLLDDDPVSMRYYTDNFQAATTKKVLFTVKSSAPDTLYYWCHFHTNQGNEITVSDPGTGGSGSGGGASVDVSDTPPSTPSAGSIWFDSATGSLFVYITDSDSSQWVQPTAPVPDFSTFSSVQITGGAQSIDASTKSDTLNFTAGTNITMTIDEASNTLTINSTGGGGGGGGSYDQSLNTSDSVTFASLTTPSFTNSGSGGAVFDSASTITLDAPDGILLENISKQSEILSSLTGATGVVAHDFGANAIFDHTSIASNFTANITNVPTTTDRALNVVLVLRQGATPYIPNAVQIDGVAQTINWVEALVPTGNANSIDVITFSLLRVGATWTVLGGYTNYG